MNPELDKQYDAWLYFLFLFILKKINNENKNKKIYVRGCQANNKVYISKWS